MSNEDMFDAAAISLWGLICFVVFDLAADTWFSVRIAGFILFIYGYISMLNYKLRMSW